MSTKDIILTDAEYNRYNRHIILPEFGLSGQQRLKGAKVLVVGSGGLGSALLLYLAGAGIGTLGIVDFDTVDATNLQRQVLFSVGDLGMLKVDAAKDRLRGLNPYIDVIAYRTRLTSQNASEIIKDYDVIADGTDNFPTRYLVNDACVLLNKPNVYASISQFEGQVSVFNYTNARGECGPNYRDLYPNPPSPGMIHNCAEAGVLGVLPGIIGSMQASEVIKVITGMGKTLSGRLFVFNALTFETRTFNISRSVDNPLNGKNPTIKSLIDYDDFCGMSTPVKPIKEITVDEFEQWKLSGHSIQVIDVREPHEYAEENIGALLLPLATLASNAGKINRDTKVVVHCMSGERSAKAIRELEEKFGFNNLYSLKGGMVAVKQNRAAENNNK